MPTLNINTIEIYLFRRDVSRRALFLLLHAAPRTRHAGVWRTLTATVAAGETPVTAAARALREATGVQAVTLWVIDYTHTYYDPQGDELFISPAIAVEVGEAETTLSPDFDDARWINAEQADNLLRWPGHREGLRRVHEDLFLSNDRGAPFRVATHG